MPASCSPNLTTNNEKKKAKMLSDNPTLEEVASYFANDQFATRAAGCTVVEASRGHAVCEMKLTEIHRNATGNVMGGAIFTLADFALAIACNIGEPPSVSVSNTIEYFSATKGEKLIATCDVDKSGRRLGFYRRHGAAHREDVRYLRAVDFSFPPATETNRIIDTMSKKPAQS